MYVWDEKSGNHRDETEEETKARWRREDAEKAVHRKEDELPPQLTKGKKPKK